MRISAIATLVFLQATFVFADWKRALPGWTYEFPRDHYAHPDFKTEWWYFTGHLRAKDGREFGYQITFFRHGTIPPGGAEGTTSRFLKRAFHFGHFAVSDISKERFHFDQKIVRGAFGEGGDQTDPDKTTIAWLDDWKLERSGNQFAFAASLDGVSLNLKLTPSKPITVNGSDGVSQKSPGAGNATHYYSITRLASSGTLKLGTESLDVAGESWFDREWGTNQLAADQVGWDWFSIQFEDNTELMIYRLRTADGGTHGSSGGTFVDGQGASRPLKSEDFRLVPGKTWKSDDSGGRYPVEWTISVPSLDLELEVGAAFKSQELALPLITYWEGAIEAGGKKNGKAIQGRGYLEMTGYAGALNVLK